jgi:cell division protein FtsB
MSTVRGRRGGTAADARRHTGRAPRVSHTRPVPGVRSAAPSRPGQRRGIRRPTRASVAAHRRPLFTGRAVLLAALILLLALTLAGPVRQYLAGRADLVRLAAEGRSLDAQAKALTAQLSQQNDPAFRERQARVRLTYVLPGDRLIMVVDGKTVQGDAGTLSAATAPPPPTSWYAGLMQSLATADGDAAGRAGK